MSVFSMVELAALDTQATAIVAAASKKSAARAETALKRVTAYIPSETISIYIAGLGIFQPSSDASKWINFAIAAALTPLFVLAAFDQQRRIKGRVPFGRQKFLILVAFSLLAYALWAAAMPQSPFISLHSEANRFAAYGAVVWSFVAPHVARWTGINPQKTN
jgi:hypothetical protein